MTPRRRSGRRGLPGDRRGVSSLEFALAAPFLVFAFLALVDIGLAVGERMTLDRVLRGAAQTAMADPGEGAVQAVADASAGSAFSGTAPVFTVDRFCACPEAAGTPVACGTTCAGSAPTAIFYRLAAAHSYTGMILPDIDLSTAAQVQIR